MTRFEYEKLKAILIRHDLKISDELRRVAEIFERCPDAVLIDRIGQLKSFEASISKFIEETLLEVWKYTDNSEKIRLRTVSGGK